MSVELPITESDIGDLHPSDIRLIVDFLEKTESKDLAISQIRNLVVSHLIKLYPEGVLYSKDEPLPSELKNMFSKLCMAGVYEQASSKYLIENVPVLLKSEDSVYLNLEMSSFEQFEDLQIDDLMINLPSIEEAMPKSMGDKRAVEVTVRGATRTPIYNVGKVVVKDSAKKTVRRKLRRSGTYLPKSNKNALKS